MAAPSASARLQHGLTILELMIGMTIGLIASLVIAQVFSQSEAHRRATTGSADSQQSGTIAAWRMMRDIRMAGSGLQHGPTIWGCALDAWLDGTQLLPRAVAWPAPFAGFPGALPLAPVVVLSGGGTAPDAILTMSARTSASAAAIPATVLHDSEFTVTAAVAMAPRDVLLMTDMITPNAPCRVGQVADGFVVPAVGAPPRNVPTGAPGTRYNGPGGFTTMPAGGDLLVSNLGMPSFTMYGVTNRSLVQYDVLQTNGVAVPTVQAENVESLQVLLGLDDGTAGVANDNVIDRWVRPTTVGAWGSIALLNGGPGTVQVKALRVALVVRSPEPVQGAMPVETVVFPDQPTALQVRIPIAGGDRQYPRQIYEQVIPLRNQWIALCSENRRAVNVPAAGACS